MALELDASVPNTSSDSLDPLEARARRFIGGLQASGELPGLADARLAGPPVALYRPDMEEPAYYEFALEPAGFVVLSTGRHDYPIPHWSADHAAPSVELAEQAAAEGREIAKVYKLDTLSYAAEDASGELVARVGGLPLRIDVEAMDEASGREVVVRRWHPELDSNTGAELETGFAAQVVTRPFGSWVSLKAEYSQIFAQHLRQLEIEAKPAWEVSDKLTVGEPDPQPAADSWEYSWADGSAGGIYYEQMSANYSPYNLSPCASGCGATVWAILLAWADRQAANPGGEWDAHGGIYRKDGGYGADAIAPTNENSGVRTVMQELRLDIKTFCVGDQGATWPSNMIRASNYLAGRDDSSLVTAYNSFGFNSATLVSAARNTIQAGTPAIIGTGWLTHYPLAYGYASHPTEGNYYCVNQGWVNHRADWVTASTWFFATIVP